jgi:hypothetical protein
MLPIYLRKFYQASIADFHNLPPHNDVAHEHRYWWSRAVDGKTNLTGPASAASAAGFYANLMAVRSWWDVELAAEGTVLVCSAEIF